MTTYWKAVLVVGAAALAAVQGNSQPGPPGQICSGFSEDHVYRDPPLSWRFRSCTTTGGQREIHVQFHNRSDRPLMFEYRLWTDAQKNCRTDEPPTAQGVKQLAALENEDWPYTVTTLDKEAGFNGRIWVCVREVSS
jgi:hypothetical protein